MSTAAPRTFGNVFLSVLLAVALTGQLPACNSRKSRADAALSSGGTGGSGEGSSEESGSGEGGSEVDAAANDSYVVAMVQSAQAQAADITQAEVAALVESAVSQAGGLDFIHDGQTVVLKPNLVTPYTDVFMRTPADPLVNGIATDWRVVKATADLVRARNPTGKILVMEGSVVPAATAFSLLGYTAANFGSAVDEFLGFEGNSCSDRGTDGLEQRLSSNGVAMWVNQRYVHADVVISLPVLKTHATAGITGAVKNLGIGTTPVAQYAAPPPDGGTSQDCTRGQAPPYIDHTSAETLGQFIHDYYSIRPADFVVMDALQGLQHGPLPAWDMSGRYSYADSKMNMRLVLAGRNAVAVDTVAAQVMKCDASKVPHLAMLAADGLGTTDLARITVVGKQPSQVAVAFAGKQTDICHGE